MKNSLQKEIARQTPKVAITLRVMNRSIFRHDCRQRPSSVATVSAHHADRDGDFSCSKFFGETRTTAQSRPVDLRQESRFTSDALGFVDQDSVRDHPHGRRRESSAPTLTREYVKDDVVLRRMLEVAR